jgi:hypothetical protein
VAAAARHDAQDAEQSYGRSSLFAPRVAELRPFDADIEWALSGD